MAFGTKEKGTWPGRPRAPPLNAHRPSTGPRARPALERHAGDPLYTCTFGTARRPSPILRSGPRHFPSARIVTMRGRTFRRPLTTTRDGRARGRGGRLPGDQCLTCPPLAAAHWSPARRGAPAGRTAAAAHRHTRAGRRLGHRLRGARHTHSQRPHGRRHSHRVGNSDQHRQAGSHGRPRGTAGGPRADHPLGHRQCHQEQQRHAGGHRPGGRRQVHREVLPADAGRRRALLHLGSGRRTGPRRQRRLSTRRLALRGDVRAALGAGARYGADVPAVAVRRGRHPDEDDVPVAPDLHRPHDGGDRVERAADARLPQRRPGQGDLSGRPPRSAPVTGQGPRRHLGDRPGPAGIRRRDDPHLPGQVR